METHLKFNAIYISKDGKLLAMNKPEKKNFQQSGNDIAEEIKTYNLALESAISAAEDEDIEFKDMKRWYYMNNEPRGQVHPLPSGWEIRVEEKCQHKGIHNSTCIYKKVALLVRVEEKEELNDVPEVNIKPVYRPVYRSERRLRVIEDLHPDKIIIPVEGKEEPKEEKMPIELPDLPQEDKDRIMKQALETASYCLLFAMKVTKSENFINGKLNNNGTEYELSFKRSPLPSPPSNP